jgi:hypothetical protein
MESGNQVNITTFQEISYQYWRRALVVALPENGVRRCHGSTIWQRIKFTGDDGKWWFTPDSFDKLCPIYGRLRHRAMWHASNRQFSLGNNGWTPSAGSPLI